MPGRPLRKIMKAREPTNFNGKRDNPMDELHGKTVKRKDKTEVIKVPKKLRKRLSKKRAKHGFIRLWP